MAKLEFPTANARVEIARDLRGNAIGVTVTMLVLTNDIKDLPDPFRESAQAILYAEAVNK